MYGRLFLILTLFLSACSLKKEVVFEKIDDNISSNSLESRLLRAFAYQNMNDFNQSNALFLSLFKEYQNEFFLEYAFNAAVFNNLASKDELDRLSKPYLSSNATLARLHIVYLLEKGAFNEAQTSLENLLKWDKDFRNYELLGDLYIQKNDFKQALSSFRLSKARINAEFSEANELLTLKITQSLILLGREKEATRELESFVKAHGCTLRICLALAQGYAKTNDINKLKSLYIKLYQSTKDINFIYNLAELYISEKAYDKALESLQNYGAPNDEMLLFLYQQLAKHDLAMQTALELYEKTKDKKYLLMAAIDEFELALSKSKDKRVSKEIINSVAAKFEQGIEPNSLAIFLNYYGYLLIDYDLNVARGIELVELALKQEPSNLYYIDSLAWGFYKQGKCEQAWDIMLQTMHDSSFSSEPESKEHIKAIQKCLESKKNP